MGNKCSKKDSKIDFNSDSRVSSRSRGRESMLDITGKNYTRETTGQEGNESKDASDNGNGHGPRLANIFMSPVKIEENFQYPEFEKSEADKGFIQFALQDNFIFADVNKIELTRLLNAFEKQEASCGTHIITEGEVGDYFYLIHTGKVEFTVGGERVGESGPGRSFGDLALLYDCPRAATCIAAEDCVLWRVDQKSFRQILANGRLDGDRETIDTLRKVSFLADLSEEYLAKMASAASTKTFAKNEQIITKGDIGLEFFILKEGSVAVKNIEVGGITYDDQVLKEGDFFGERAIVTTEPRVADIIALQECTTLFLSREDFLNVLGPLEKLMKKSQDLRELRSIPVFNQSDVDPMEYEELVARIVEKTFPANTDIFTEGKVNDRAMYFVRSGEVALSSTDTNVKIANKAVTAGAYFGVECSMMAKVPTATAVISEESVLGVLTLDDIKSVIRDMSRLEHDSAKQKVKKIPIELEELTKHRILGVGTFGKVWLVSRKNPTNGKLEAYAMKVQRKRQLIRHAQVEGVIREIKVMASLSHPFILKLINVYQDEETVMMLLAIVQGGELYSIMKRHKNMMLPERDSKFYASSILEGLHYMHYHSILYRDLKPENVLIDKDGYAVIVDLGFAKIVTGKTFTLCGTPWYIAPEVILGRGHDKACDYWSWAILVHEMCTGDTPFQDHGVDQMTLFKGIVKGKYKISPRAGEHVADLVRSILITKPQYRLGNTKDGIHGIKSHNWLRDVDFNKISKKVFRAPWTPNVSDPLDSSEFDNWDHMEKEDKEKPLSSAEKLEFSAIDEISMR